MRWLMPVLALPVVFLLVACENGDGSTPKSPLEKILGAPGGIAFSDYSSFQELAPPKVLFSCDVNKTRDPALECFVENMAEVREGTVDCGYPGDNAVEYIEHVYVGYIAQLGPMLTYNKML